MSSASASRSSGPPEHPDRDPSDADDHRAAVSALLITFKDWMRERCRRVARRYDLDADDIFQLTSLRLLRSGTTADPTHNGIRTWLARRIDWAARELARQRRRDGGERIAGEEVDALLAQADVRASGAAAAGGNAVDTRLLDRIGLTRHQIHVVLSECSELDLSLREYAHLVGRSYAAIRKDKQRALDRIERWVGMSHEERRVFIAFRLTGSVEAAARRTGHTPSELRRLLNTAHKKVDEAFTERRVNPTASTTLDPDPRPGSYLRTRK